MIRRAGALTWLHHPQQAVAIAASHEPSRGRRLALGVHAAAAAAAALEIHCAAPIFRASLPRRASASMCALRSRAGCRAAFLSTRVILTALTFGRRSSWSGVAYAVTKRSRSSRGFQGAAAWPTLLSKRPSQMVEIRDGKSGKQRLQAQRLRVRHLRLVQRQRLQRLCPAADVRGWEGRRRSPYNICSSHAEHACTEPTPLLGWSHTCTRSSRRLGRMPRHCKAPILHLASV